jgi:urease accessory protein
MIRLLHLCDTLFPIGGFGYSDGLEAAVVRLKPDTTGVKVRLKPDTTDAISDRLKPAATDAIAALRAWMDVVLDESIGRLDGPTVWRAWLAVADRDWNALASLDGEVIALRASSSARRSSRAMGLRLLTTWHGLHPDDRLERALSLAQGGALGPALPIAFAAACVSADIDRRQTVEAFAYTRLAGTISAAMRLMPIGQIEAHSLLARALDRVPLVVDAIAQRNTAPESFAPALDIAMMSQQYLHSRLFRT